MNNYLGLTMKTYCRFRDNIDVVDHFSWIQWKMALIRVTPDWP